jgi:hypothetical protein
LSTDSFGNYPSALVKRPPGLNDLSGRVFDVLATFTAFPWPVLETQAKRLKKDPRKLERADLPELIPKLIEALARFAAPEKVALAEAQLQKIA